MTKQNVPITMLSDSKSLFDVITKSTCTSEKRLMIDISAVREAYGKQEISDVGFVTTKNNPADAFTKITYCEALQSIIDPEGVNCP